MFEIEREKCYAGIKRCDAFLKNCYVYASVGGSGERGDTVVPENAILRLPKTREFKVIGFFLQAKNNFIQQLAEMQEAENIAEYAQNARG